MPAEACDRAYSDAVAKGGVAKGGVAKGGVAKDGKGVPLPAARTSRTAARSDCDPSSGERRFGKAEP